MRWHLFRTAVVALSIVLAASNLASAQSDDTPTTPAAKPASKEVLLPERIIRVPSGNDFNNPDSEFCYQRSKSSDDFVMFWAKEYGDDPAANPDQTKRFDVDFALKECERFYDYYTNTLKWVDKEKSFAAKYKFLIFVIGGRGGTAFGGSIDNKIGALWTPASRLARTPYGVLAHELGHSFQAILRADGSPTFRGGSINEMTSQYMLWQVYPEWMTFENYHLVDFMKATNLAFLHQDNQYHSAYVLEYWSNKHGVDFIAKLWREAKRDEDPVLAYQRLTSITQEQFNDEMFDAATPVCHLGHAAHRQCCRPLCKPAHDIHYRRRRRLVSDSPRKMPAKLRLQCDQTESSRGQHQDHARFRGHRRRRRLPQHPPRESRLAVRFRCLQGRPHSRLQRYLFQIAGHC